MVLMGVLATEMAHELSKPLTHILNVSSRLECVLNPEARVELTKIERETMRASDILESFAMLSPVTDLQRVYVSLADILDDSIELLGLQEDLSVRIIRRYAAIPPILINPGQLTQVFTNVIQNAWQAMPDGGHLILSLQKATEPYLSAWVTIEDTGSGIPAAILSRVFEPFFTTKKEQGGRGVGLTLSRAMIERHDGALSLESPTRGIRGTRVSIRLPWETKGSDHANG
jgi:signal transduction histidine kinase